MIVKLRNADDSFKKSIIIPTVTYPLNGEISTFTYENTKEVTDENILSIIDSVPYKISFCYENTTRIVEKLQEAGYDAVPYVGWLFMARSEFPVHHCWCVLNGESVIDLADNFNKLFDFIAKSEERDNNAEVFIRFEQEARKHKNRERCATVGVPSANLLYVGSPCEPEKGRQIYRRLIAEMPDHECQRNCNANGYNRTQQKFAEAGLM